RPAVLLVPYGRGDFLNIDVLAFEYVLQERAAVHGSRRLGRPASKVKTAPLEFLHLRALRRQPPRAVCPPRGGEDVCGRRRALRIPGNFVEDDGRVAHPANIDVDEAADLLLRLGAPDVFQFAGSFDASDPVTQILIGHVYNPAAFTSAALMAISRANCSAKAR